MAENEKANAMSIVSKLGMKGELLGGLEKEAMGEMFGGILDKIQPFIEPMIGQLGKVLGTEYMCIIRNEKDGNTSLIVMEKCYIKKFEFEPKAIFLAMPFLEFIKMAINPSGGIEDLFKKKIEERKNEK